MPIYYTERELDRILSPRDGQRNVFIPNEIFSDLVKAINVYEDGKSSKHIAFAFCYHYLITYIYRYARFHYHAIYDFTEEELKKICTVSPNSKGKGSYNYITKRNGLLEQLGYITKVSDFPVAQNYHEWDKEVVFTMWSEYKDDLVDNAQFGKTRNKKVNEPLKLTETRIVVKSDGTELETMGTLYEIDFTTKVSVDVFIYCMSREDLGCEGFYLYCYLKYMNIKYKHGWNCPLDDMPLIVGMKRDIVVDRLKALEEYNMIYNSHVPFVPNLCHYTDQKVHANTYKVKEYIEFVKAGQPKKTIEKRKVLSFQAYENIYGFRSLVDQVGDIESPLVNEG